MPDARKAAVRAARKYEIDPSIFLAQIQQESGFNPRARSGAGAQGIAQFIPSTAKQYGVNLNDGRITDDLNGAAKLMRDALAKNGGNYHRALSVYNSGRPDGYKSIPETANYVRTILAGKKGTTARGGGSVTTIGDPVTKRIPGVDRSSSRQALLQQYLTERGKPGALLALKAGLDSNKDTPARSVLTPGKTTTTRGSSAPVKGGAVARFDGKPVAAWIASELSKARAAGWKGTVTSGYRSYADQQRIYNSGVRPAAKPGQSNHEFKAFPGGAVDVTNAPELAAILKRIGSPLVWAGAKDQPHFSHPHNGGY